MPRLSMHDTFVGISTPLAQFAYNKNVRSTPEVRVSYVDAEGKRQIVNICVSGARTLAKALNEMANKADPPTPRKR